MKSWQCIVCGFIYEEAKGLPEDGIAPGTAWLISLKIGNAQIAASQNQTLKWFRSAKTIAHLLKH